MEKELDSRTFIVEQNTAEGTQIINEVKKHLDKDTKTMVTFEESPKAMESGEQAESKKSSGSEIEEEDSEVEEAAKQREKKKELDNKRKKMRRRSVTRPLDV